VFKSMRPSAALSRRLKILATTHREGSTEMAWLTVWLAEDPPLCRKEFLAMIEDQRTARSCSCRC
jgi:hypothetical protein